jgi:hypothetical protein
VHAELTVAGSRATKMSGPGKVPAPAPVATEVSAEPEVLEPDGLEPEVLESEVWRAARERRRAAPPRVVSRRPPGRGRP